jgi:predicted  nucleic acid-binding Zn-ribbon protein
MSKKKGYSPEAKFGGIVKRQLISVKEDLTTIKDQLTSISDSVDNLRDRIEEIEKMLKAPKAKAKES